MGSHLAAAIVARKYVEKFDAEPRLCFGTFLTRQQSADSGAALGYRRAGGEPLFLERYLDLPVEQAVSDALGRPVARGAIVEIGNFAADNAMLMLQLWGTAANDLGGTSEIAVATLTAPLRRIFGRIGIPITILAPARAERLGPGADEWGSYYAQDPQVCLGTIAAGQAAIVRWLERRTRAGAAA